MEHEAVDGSGAGPVVDRPQQRKTDVSISYPQVNKGGHVEPTRASNHEVEACGFERYTVLLTGPRTSGLWDPCCAHC